MKFDSFSLGSHVHSSLAGLLHSAPLLTVITALVLAPPALAQPTPKPVAPAASLAELRAELEAAQAAAPPSVPKGTWTSIAYTLDVVERIAGGRYTSQAEAWRRRAATYLARAKQGVDPFPELGGQITNRGYESPISLKRQGYAIHLPRDYDPKKSYPLMVMLHGGSANGNLFLGVVLGNNMNWKEYPQHLWDDFTPRWSPDWIVVAPDGYGQIIWRWMGEQDVLDVIDDVQQHYNVDADRVVLGGLSNGGMGAYAVGMRHAWRFSAVLAIAGAPSWLQYAGGRPSEVETRCMQPLSGMHLTENVFNTHFRFYHGHHDPGPMKPAYVRAFSEHIAGLGVPYKETWYDAGHDLLYIAHRHGRIYDDLAKLRRDPRPKEVRLVTGDYRANRQHWLSVTRIADYPQLARVRAVVTSEQNTARLEVTTEQALALRFDLRTLPLEGASAVQLQIDGQTVYEGPDGPLGHAVYVARVDGRWRLGFLPDPEGAGHKRPGLSGPLTDPYFDGMLHVYGTGDAAQSSALEAAARRGSKGWPLWLWQHDQRVVADTELTEELLRRHHLVLYGTPGTNRILERVAAQLPIQVTPTGVRVGAQNYPGKDVGTRFVHPNPLAPDRYLIVQAGTSLQAVQAGHQLPDFLPDYVVYDSKTTRSRPRLNFGGNRPLDAGYFDGRWRLKQEGLGEGGDPASDLTAPADVPPATDPAAKAARTLAQRVARMTRNYRGEAPLGRWQVAPDARWSIRSSRACLATLKSLGVSARPLPDALPTPVATPVEITGPVGGVWFRSAHEDRTVVVACELAARLPALAKILADFGVVGVDVMSSYRPQPRQSYHSFGLALDLLRFWTRDGILSVPLHYAPTPDQPTCEGPEPGEPRARSLRAIACALADSRVFSTVLTPNYNEGHRDHFHLDARPDDPRLFVR